MVQFDIAEVQPNKLPKLSMVLVGAELGLRGSAGGQGSLSHPGSSRPELGCSQILDSQRCLWKEAVDSSAVLCV